MKTTGKQIQPAETGYPTAWWLAMAACSVATVVVVFFPQAIS